ncbi:methionine biosynthesis protein MetW [Methylobacterium indicum]|nr:methionine biosynthesis protein MetW [Methylobacterium indicum]
MNASAPLAPAILPQDATGSSRIDHLVMLNLVEPGSRVLDVG